MPLLGDSRWPKQFGFGIVGQGPCFVYYVKKNGIAHNSGLQVGDQILELDDQVVINLSADALKTLAKHSESQPPTLTVVSSLMHVELSGRLGFTINDSKPVTVTSVDDDGPADIAGIQPGDIIVAVDNMPVDSISDLPSYLANHSKHLSVHYIPLMAYTKSQTHSNSSTGSSMSCRAKRSRQLHDKMNEILNDDYEKKMAVVGVLKQYAEVRDVDMLARALSVILKTHHHRQLLRQIRPFIPPRQRVIFDSLTRQQQQQQHMSKVKKEEKQSKVFVPTAHKLGQRRVLQIIREKGSFGFVIRGSNPAYIETVDDGGPAEKAGLQPGDFIMALNGIDVRKFSHSHLVELLQDSGSSPVIEILRFQQEQIPMASGSSVSASSSFSNAESHWKTPDNQLIVDKEGRTYLDRVEYFLTTNERDLIKKAWIDYESTGNIVVLYKSVSQVLDTPSKKTLWMFILARLLPHHQQYIIDQIELPKQVLQECVEHQKDVTNRKQNTPGNVKSSLGLDSPKVSIKITTFQQQVDYLLTSRERLLLKKALQLYLDKRNVDHLIEDLEVILDTHSKRALWRYVMPLLTQLHQDVVRQIINNKSMADTGTVSMPGKSFENTTNWYLTTDAEHELFSQSSDRKQTFKQATPPVKRFGPDQPLIDEVPKTCTIVQEAKQVLSKGRKPDVHHGHLRYVTIIPVEQSPTSIHLHGHPLTTPVTLTLTSDYNSPHEAFNPTSYEVDTTPLLSPVSNRSYVNDMFASFDSRPMPPIDVISNGDNKEAGASIQPSVFLSTRLDKDSRFKISANFMTSGTDSDIELENAKKTTSQSKFAQMGGNTFNRHALTALKQLDATVATKVSDLPNGFVRENTDPPNKKSGPQTNQDTTLPIPLPPPLPPQAAPPPPPLLISGADADVGDTKGGQMNVKRINWEKLDQQKLENTVWEQIRDTDDLQDVLRFLELEQHFSTKSSTNSLILHLKIGGKTGQEVLEKKDEVHILNPKKSYNISILLGHLKLSLSEVRQALYLLDEDILNPELLRQLLAYAPNKQEMEQFDSYNGDTEKLSQPDRFTYEMSRVPGYEQRLRALIFKGNFQEKINEMKEHLLCIRKASLELRHSKRLSKILELILAMGNYMNQGNQRVGEAAGFKISFLSQMDITKTSDNKLTFLHVLAEAVFAKFPEMLSVGEELTTVPEAAKYSNVLLTQELQDLRKVLQDISNTLEKFGAQKTSLGINDKFQDVMGHFISQASDEVQSLLRLNASTMEEFQNTVQYFGEDPKEMTTKELFGVFAEFIKKFEKAHRYNMMHKRHGSDRKLQWSDDSMDIHL